MLSNLSRKFLLFGMSLLLVLVGPVPLWSQTSQNRISPIRSQQDLALALLKTQTERPGDVARLLEDNSNLLSQTFWQEIIFAAARSYHQDQHDRAFLIYEIARQVALRLNDLKLVAKTYYDVGRSYSGLNQFDKAKAAYMDSKKAFAAAGLQRDLIYILSDLGTLSLIQEDYLAARTYSEESLKLAEGLKTTESPAGAWPDNYGAAGALATLGELAAREGSFAEAIEYLQRSLTLYQQLDTRDSSYDYYVADIYASLGRVYTSAGDYVKALALLNKALIISKSTRNRDQEASLLNSIGVLYMEQEDYAQAGAKFQESLNLYNRRKNQREESRVLLNLGVIEQRQQNYDDAIVRFRRSLEAAKASQNADVQLAAGEGIGVALTGKREYPAALQALNDCLALAKEMKDRTRQTELVWRSAEVHLAMSDYERSSELAQAALTMAKELHAPKLIYLATTTLGQSYAAQDKTELAIQTLKAALEQVEAMRNQVAGQKVSRQLFFENKVDSYHSLIELFAKQDKVFEALLFAEQAKGRVLLDILGGGRVDITKHLTTAERAEIQRLNREISEINDRIRLEESRTSKSLESLYRQLDAARLQYRSFEDALYVTHPDLKLRSGQTPSLTNVDLNHLTINAGTAYIEYVVTREQVYVFVLTRKSTDEVTELRMYPLPVKPADLKSKVDQFHQRLANRHPDFAELARELFVVLIEPANNQLRGVSTFCIIPDGFLWSLPFQALMKQDNSYLVEKHALYYAHSLSLLREITKDGGDKNGGRSVIAFGNPVIGRDEQRNEDLCPLPEAETEVTSIASTLRSGENKILIGRQASERSFKALSPTYNTIHLATHGVIDNRNPLYSHLLLTKTKNDTENDGLLEAREIMNLNLNADLAVLSACETGNGRFAPGEGVMGMSWAFFVAGTRSMLVSQWKVNSASTSQLMMSFYQALESSNKLSKSKKADALQRAALKILKDRQYRHPFYWAGFVLIGSK